MGATLIAILTAALVLPGILAARAFYQAGRIVEVEPSVPSLSSSEGLAMVGAFSLAVHLLYALALTLVADLPDVTGLPLANPYRFFAGDRYAAGQPDDVLAIFLGLTLLCFAAFAVGQIAGQVMMRLDRVIFYGPMTELVAAGQGDSRYIAAYVLTTIEHGEGLLAYQGTVTNLVRDGDQFPVKVMLKNASTFIVKTDATGTVRREETGTIDWIALSSEGWQNIAFRVFELVADSDSSPSGDD